MPDIKNGSINVWTSDSTEIEARSWKLKIADWNYLKTRYLPSIDLNINIKSQEDVMQIYEIIIVDKKECEILFRQEVIAEDRETAMLEIKIDDSIRQAVKKGQIEFIFNCLGEFEKC